FAAVCGLFLLTPVNAHSVTGDELILLLGGIGVFAACLLTVVFFIGLLALPVVAFVFACRLIYVRYFRDRVTPGGDSRLFDFGAVGLVLASLSAASLENTSVGFSFDPHSQSSSRLIVDAPASTVWRAMKQATTPDFPLPEILRVFPQPTAVLIDEGIRLGSRRVVRFEGREGRGRLSMVVVERTPTKVTFKVLSDTTPIANWVRHEKLIYEVVPHGAQTELSVSLHFERRLAPSWFFTPVMKASAFLAMDVLARDTKARAEAL
ncbi:MAG: SRPBCC family protein, partial [Pseudomonadota bacterium]